MFVKHIYTIDRTNRPGMLLRQDRPHTMTIDENCQIFVSFEAVGMSSHHCNNQTSNDKLNILWYKIHLKIQLVDITTFYLVKSRDMNY